jgi:hypothetical protein
MASIGPLFGRAAAGAKRVWPIALEAYRRWDQLPEDKKEQYRQQARDLADRGRSAVQSRSPGKRKR